LTSFLHFFFQVTVPPTPTSVQDDAVFSKQDLREAFYRPAAVAPLPLGPHDLPQFFVYSGFTSELPALFSENVLETLRITHLPEQVPEDEKVLIRLTQEYFTKVLESIQKNSYTRFDITKTRPKCGSC